MKRILSVILSLMIFSGTAFATDTTSGGIGGGGGSAGGGGMVSGGTVSGGTVVSVKKEYTVSGTIYLPAGMTAPADGLDIYGGFGGVTLNEVSLASVEAEEVKDEVIPEYESYEVIATIPAGQSYVTYTKTVTISGDNDGIYGKFWVYDDVTINGVTLSNKQTISSITQLKADVYTYKNLNCTLNEAEEIARFDVTGAKTLQNEDIQTEVYIIADDGYERYIRRANITDISQYCNVKLNLESAGDYDVYYYIPESRKMNLQKLDKGLFSVGTLDTSTSQRIYLKEQLYFSGNIKMPKKKTAEKDINVSIITQTSSVDVVIPKGAQSVPYVVGAFGVDVEKIEVTVDDDYLLSGFPNYQGIVQTYADYFEWENEGTAVEDFDITMAEQCVIKGTITLPEDVVMEENTYFSVNVNAGSRYTSYEQTENVVIYSDTRTAEYKIFIPEEDWITDFSVSYDYGSYTKVTGSMYAENPLKYIVDVPSYGGSGGGGSSMPATHIKDGVAYSFKKPKGLLYNCKVYLNENGVSLFGENADEFPLICGDVIRDFCLAKEGESGLITGYFENTMAYDITTPVEIQLYDGAGNLLETKSVDNNEGYYFDNLTLDVYKLGVNYEGRQYYYKDKWLVTDIAQASEIRTKTAGAVTHCDMFYENIFPADVSFSFNNNIMVDGIDMGSMQVRVCDTYGNVRWTGETSRTVRAKFSKFYLKLGDYFVSRVDKKDGVCTIARLTDDFNRAYLFEAEYADTLSAEFHEESDDTFIVNAETRLSVTPITSTQYNYSEGNLNFTVSLLRPLDMKDIIIAAYDDTGRMVDMTRTTAVESEAVYPLTMKYDESIKSVKVMVWSALNSEFRMLNPMGAAEKIEIITPIEFYNEYLKNMANVYLEVGSSTVYGLDITITADFPTEISDGTIYAVGRPVAEMLDWSVSWDDAEQAISCTYDNQTCVMRIGSSIADYSCDGGEVQQIEISGAPILRDGRAMIPCGDICEIFGYGVYTDIDNGVLTIFDEVGKRDKYALDNGVLNPQKIKTEVITEGITRAELASLLVAVYEKSTGIPAEVIENPFVDTGDIDALKAYALGILRGTSEETFNPKGTVTYAELATIAYRTSIKINPELSHLYGDVPEYPEHGDIPEWAKQYVYECKKLGFFDGVCYEHIDANGNVNRRDAIAVMANVFERLIN